MNYIMSEGPYSDINEIEGTETPYWVVTEYDENDSSVYDYPEMFYDRDKCIDFANKEARRKRIEHVCGAIYA